MIRNTSPNKGWKITEEQYRNLSQALIRRNLRFEDSDITQNGVFIARLIQKMTKKHRKTPKSDKK